MNKKMMYRSLAALAVSAVLVSGTPATAADLDLGTGERGIITLDSGTRGITLGTGQTVPDKDTKYNAPTEFIGELSDKDRKEISLALAFGNAVSNGEFPSDFYASIGHTEAGGEELRQEVAVAVSQITNVVLDDGASDDSLSPIAQGIRSLADKLPDNHGSDLKVMISSPADESFQSLVSLNDSTIPTLPDIATIIDNSTEGDISLRTSAGEGHNGIKEGVHVVDIVSYDGLVPGKTYVMEGEAVDQTTGSETGENTGRTEFVADASGSGRVTVNIEMNVTHPKMVVFETLKDENGVIVAEHKDVNDRAQQLGNPGDEVSLRTTALASTGNNIQSGTTVSDSVRYTGLQAGKEYRLETRLMCKSTGNDTGASASTVFTASAASGATTVEDVKVTDPDCLQQVVFEKLYDQETGELLASHEDINDLAQTVGSTTTDGKKKKDSPTTTPGQPERQVINDVPSGAISGVGSSIFTR